MTRIELAQNSNPMPRLGKPTDNCFLGLKTGQERLFNILDALNPWHQNPQTLIDSGKASYTKTMVKSYLRYEQAAAFGVIASGDSNITYDSSGKHLLAPALEKVGVWHVRQGVCTKTLTPSTATSGKSISVTSIASSPTSLVKFCFLVRNSFLLLFLLQFVAANKGLFSKFLLSSNCGTLNNWIK